MKTTVGETPADEQTSEERTRKILEERARALAQVPPQSLQAGDTEEVLIFGLGGEKYALSTDGVREVLRFGDCVAVPGTPDLLVGVTNLRGQILAIFDLRRHFGIAVTEHNDTAWIIVVGGERAEFGLLADAVFEVARVRADQMLPPPEALAVAVRKYVRGITEEALIVLDGSALLADPLLSIDEDDGAGHSN